MIWLSVVAKRQRKGLEENHTVRGSSELHELKAENEVKKEYLNQYGKMCRQIQRIEERIREIRHDKMCPAIRYDDMPRGNTKSDLSDYVASLDTLEQEYIVKMREKTKLCEEIHDCIEKLGRENEKDVLTFRYLGLNKWEKVCCRTGYSWTQTHHIHSEALKHLELPSAYRTEHSIHDKV